MKAWCEELTVHVETLDELRRVLRAFKVLGLTPHAVAFGKINRCLR